MTTNGWIQLITDLDKDIKETVNYYKKNERNVTASVTAHEKYGTLRIEWDNISVSNIDHMHLKTHTKDLSNQLKQLGDKFIKKSQTICMECGDPSAKLNINKFGKYKTFCDYCRKKDDPYLFAKK